MRSVRSILDNPYPKSHCPPRQPTYKFPSSIYGVPRREACSSHCSACKTSMSMPGAQLFGLEISGLPMGVSKMPSHLSSYPLTSRLALCINVLRSQDLYLYLYLYLRLFFGIFPAASGRWRGSRPTMLPDVCF